MSEIRYVTVPADRIVIINNGEKDVAAQVPFAKFIDERTADATAFGATLDGIMMGLAIRQSFKGSSAGSVIGLPLNHWEALCGAIRNPKDGYNVPVMIQLVAYAQAVIDAPSKRPEAALATAAE